VHDAVGPFAPLCEHAQCMTRWSPLQHCEGIGDKHTLLSHHTSCVVGQPTEDGLRLCRDRITDCVCVCACVCAGVCVFKY